MRSQWRAATPAQIAPSASFMAVFPALGDPVTRSLLVLALINAAPVAASTLFLFFSFLSKAALICQPFRAFIFWPFSCPPPLP
ncbi:MAG: hypothetical protein U5N55_01000, partial [Cypionkella sp.]|nr:hypothetical protein [Cypionkella sp.]